MSMGVAVVGCGAMAQLIHLPNIARHPGLDLLWCCDINRGTLDTVGATFGRPRLTTDAAEVAADPDVRGVILSTTQAVRLPLIEIFARAGKHIYVEKPLADSFDEMKRILRVVEETGIRLTVGHNRRMAPAVMEAVRVLNKHRADPVSPPWRWDREGPDRPRLDGERTTQVMIRVNDDWWSWKKWAFAHGALINEMTHFADLACCFIDSAPIRVTVTGGTQANHVIAIEFEDGSLASIFATAFGSFGYPKELVEVYHNGAAIIVDHLVELRVAGVLDEPSRTVFPIPNDPYPEIEEQGIEGFYRRTEAAQREALAKGDNSIIAPIPDKGHFALLDDFVRSIETGAEPACSARTAAVPTAVILRALESVDRGGVPVEIRPEDYSLSP